MDTRSDDLPVADRLAWWRERTRNAIFSSLIRCDQEAEFHASARAVSLGNTLVSRLSYSSLQYSRSERLIRQSDPEQLILALNLQGRLGLTVARQERVLDVRDFVLYDTSHAFHGWTADDGVPPAVQLLVQFPRTLLPLGSNMIDRIVAVPLPGHDGIGAVVCDYLTGLVRHADRYRSADVARLSTITLDLITTLVAHHLDATAAVPPTTRQRVLQARIHDFVERRLGDPALSPGTIATAHGISLRYLHKLFQDRGLTVAGWIRQRRLERCRRDLADPGQGSRPVHAIASRYGFTSDAHFSRLFAATFGQSPSAYRRSAWER